ncbi:hypothetical protein F9K78_12935 [Brucella pseudintermedia]|nr:hypothetical protein F9K78_12935 [Brucella pseudintermedia]
MLVSSCYEHRISPSKGGFKRGCAGKTGSNREKQNSCQLAETDKLTANFVMSGTPDAGICRCECVATDAAPDRMMPNWFIRFGFTPRHLASHSRNALNLTSHLIPD